MKVLIDTGVLGRLCHPRKHDDVRAWFGVAVAHHEFLLSEVADYELRRELLRIGAARSVLRLDELTRELPYVPVTTATWRLGAILWAEARNGGNVTAPPDALDGDVLVAAQALQEEAIVLTTNARHFEALSVPALEYEVMATSQD